MTFFKDNKEVEIFFDEDDLIFEDNNLFVEKNKKVVLPLKFSDEQTNLTHFNVIQNGYYYGEIEFRSCSAKFHIGRYGTYVADFIYLERCDFNLPNCPNKYLYKKYNNISDVDKKKIIQLLRKYNPKIRKIFAKKNTQENLEQKLKFLMSFIWDDLDPRFHAGYNYLSLSLLDRIVGLKEKKVAMLCAGLRDVFVELLHLLEPSLQIRTVGAYRYNYFVSPTVVVNSHAFLEVEVDGHWWLLDPTFGYVTYDMLGFPIDAEKIRLIKETNNLHTINVKPLITNKLGPIFKFFEDPERLDEGKNHPYFWYFGWMDYYLCYD